MTTGSCGENGATQTGVQGECKPIDIGCIPETTGQPSYTPNKDQQPFAIDKDTNTLWVYSCNDEWIPFNVSLCRLGLVDISVLGDICNQLNIPVVYNINGVCVEGKVTLDNIAQEIAKCLDFTIIEGLGIDITGSGTPEDPYIVKTAICEFQTMTQAAVDASTSVMIVACVDGQQRLIPLRDIPTIPDLPCIPSTIGMPTNTPTGQDSRFKRDCDDSLWVFTCDNGWVNIRAGHGPLDPLTPADVNDICNTLMFHATYDHSGGCPITKDMTLNQLSVEIQKCICASIQTVTTVATHAMVCGPDGIFVLQPLPEIPEPVDECCDCYESESFLAGGGACFQVDTTPTQTLPSVFRGRDLSFIRGTGTNAFDLNGVGMKSIVINNPTTCPMAVRVNLSLLASRTLPLPAVGLSFLYMISETVTEAFPTDDPLSFSLFDFNPANLGFLRLGTLLNYDQPNFGEAINNNYSAEKGANVYWEAVIPAGASKTFIAQWWAVFALQVGAPADTETTIFGHATMQLNVQKNEGGVIINPVQL